MNKSYRLIWSDAVQAWVAVAEFVRSRSKKSAAVVCLAGLAQAALAAPLAPPAPTALPTGGEKIAGQVAIVQSGSRMDINQDSARAIINWNSFDIGSGAQVNFHQPSASSITLNRVLSSAPSQIFGQLTANGQVFLVNPNGVIFGAGARVDVGGIVASTLKLADQDFLAGTYRFTAGNGAGEISNQGILNALSGGYVALVAPKIANDGTVSATGGTAALVAGNTVSLHFANDRLISYDVSAAGVATLIANQGAVRAEGGLVLLTAKSAAELATSAINNTGLVDASSATAEGGVIRLEGGFVGLGGTLRADGQSKGGSIAVQAAGTLSLAENVSAVGHGGTGGSVAYGSGGRIIETATSRTDVSGASDGGSIRVDAAGGLASSGTYVATGASGAGGRIDLTGDTVRLLSAQADASGATTGGLVRVGGAFQGGKLDPAATAYDQFVARWGATPAIRNARRTFINDGTRIDVSARQGTGGTAVVWSDQETTQLGRIAAAGPLAGGAVEISSAENLRHAGLAGVSGTRFLLLDPKDITIGDAAAVSSWSYQAVVGSGYTPATSRTTSADGLEVGDWFGFAVALNSSGDLLAVGTHGDDGATNTAGDAGAVHLFRFTDASFSGGSLQGIIGKGYTGGKNVNVSGLEAGDYFGRSVAINAAGDRLAVGASIDGGYLNSAPSSGAVYLFSFTDTAFSGGTHQATVGKGYTGGKNIDVAALDAGDVFGAAVALNAAGDRLAVGAVRDGGYLNAQPNTGAVHLFSFGGGAFNAGAYEGTVGYGYTGPKDINMATLTAGRYFGQAVALNANADRLAVGVVDDGSGGGMANSGAVHLYSFTDSSFNGGSLQATLGFNYSGGKNVNVPTLAANDYFGSAVSFNGAGNLLAVGTPYDDGYVEIASNSGAVYLFTFTDNNFNGGVIKAIAGKGYNTGSNVDMGTSLEAGDNFGSAVSLNGGGDRMAVGAVGDAGSGNVASNSGAVHLVTFTDTAFSGGAYAGTVGRGYTGSRNLNVTPLESGDNLGTAVALNATGDRMAVGASNDDGAFNTDSNSGAVHLFSFLDKDFNGATLQGTIGKGYVGGKNVDVAALEAFDNFGGAVALNAAGDRLAVGAAQDGGAGNAASMSGAVYLFSFTDTLFSSGTLQATLGKGYTGGKNLDVTGVASNDGFGRSVALNAAGDRLAVGAVSDDGASNTVTDSGAVYLFGFTDNSFTGGTLEATLGSGYTGGKNVDVSVLGPSNYFGRSVAFNASGDRLAVGAYYNGGYLGVAPGSGAVHLFSFLDTAFNGGTLQATLGKGYTGGKNVDVANLETNDFFGSSLALNAAGDRLAVGAINDDGQGNGTTDAGAVYLFGFSDRSFSGGTLQSILGKGYTGGKNLDVAVLEANDYFGSSVAFNATGDRLAVGAPSDWGSGNAVSYAGAVYLFSAIQETGPYTATGHTFASQADQSITVSRADLETQLGAGTNVVLQASNDITVAGPVLVTPSAGGGGDLTLRAGRNVNFNANIRTANGNLTAVAGDAGADPAHRDPGTATLTIANGVSLDVGTGTATLASGGNVVNNAGDTAIATTGAGRWLIYADDPSTSTEGFSSYNKHYNQSFILGNTPAYAASGNWFLYYLAPVLSVAPGAASITYGGTPTFTPTYSGFVDGDSNPGTVTGTATWTVGGATSTAGHAVAGSHNVVFNGGLASSLGYQFADNAGSLGELTVTPKAITTSGITANNRTYDGTTAAALNAGGATLTGVIGGDSASLDTSGAVGSFADKNAGTGKAVSIAGLALSGADAANYTVTDASGATADITARTLTTTGITANSKTYDGTTTASLNATGATITAGGIIAGDTVSLVTSGASCSFADKNVGTSKAVTVTGLTVVGTDAGNYVLVQPTGLTADITPKTLTASGITANNKVYDGTTAATANLAGASLGGTIAGDIVNLVTTGAVCSFADKNAGVNKTVSVSGLVLGGGDAGNYILLPPSGITASITPKAITTSGITANNKVYDGTTAAGVNSAGATLSGVIGGDSVSLDASGLTGSFADKNVGTGKAVTIASLALSGLDAGNYTVSDVSGATADITPALLAYVASNTSMSVGAAVPPLTGTVSGFVGGDTQASATTGVLSWTTPADSASAAGKYAIYGGGLAAANYTLIQAAGNAQALTIGEQAAVQDSGTIAAQTQATVAGNSPTAPVATWTAAQSTAQAGVIDNQMAQPAPASTTPTATDAGPVATGTTSASSDTGGTTQVASAAESDKPAGDKTEQKPAEKKQDGATAKAAPKTDAAPKGSAAFARVNLAAMSPTAIQAMLAARHEHKTQALQQGLSKLEVDKNLGQLKGCVSAAAASGGDCLATPQQMKELVRATQPNLSKAQPVYAALPTIEKKVAVLIGSNSYQDPAIPSLDSAVPDVEAVGRLLEQRLGYEVRILRDPGRKEMVKELNKLAGELDGNDSVTLYYAGHGYMVEKTRTGYWIPADAKATDPGTWISNDDISKFMGQLPAKQVMLVSDSCYSGTLTQGGGKDSLGKTSNPKEILDKRSVVVMSSGAEEPVSDEGKEGHSIFAYSLMQALGEVNSWQTGSSVYEKVRAEVTKDFPQSPQYGSAPAAGHTAGGEYLLEIRRLPQ